MRKGMHWAAQGAAVVVPVALGIPLAVDGAATIYSGYASMWWPSTKAVVTQFRAVPVHPQEDAHEEEKRPDLDQEDEEDTRFMVGWRKVRQHVDRLLNGENTLDFTVEFEYTLPDGKTYVGTSQKDANFPSRLDLECPSCMMQAETIIDFFGQPGKQFLLFYSPHTPSFSSPPLTTRKEKGSSTKEGRYPLYSLDAGMVAPTAYERLALGTSLVGVGLFGLTPSYRSQSWSQRLTSQRGLFPVFCIAAASGLSVFGLSLLLESQLAKAEQERRNARS
jgi:hypothetical protein